MKDDLAISNTGDRDCFVLLRKGLAMTTIVRRIPVIK